VNNEVERMLKEAVWHTFRYLPRLAEENYKCLSYDGGCSGPKPNKEASDQNSEASLFEPTCSVYPHRIQLSD
jgi:hypothetical protein